MSRKPESIVAMSAHRHSHAHVSALEKLAATFIALAQRNQAALAKAGWNATHTAGLESALRRFSRQRASQSVERNGARAATQEVAARVAEAAIFRDQLVAAFRMIAGQGTAEVGRDLLIVDKLRRSAGRFLDWMIRARGPVEQWQEALAACLPEDPLAKFDSIRARL